MDTEKMIPNNPNAERAVLSSALSDPDAMENVSMFLLPDHFFQSAHRLIFAVMLDLYRRRLPVDLVMVQDALDAQGHLDNVGGPAYMTGLLADFTTSLYAEHYARLVQRDALLRTVIKKGGTLAELGYNGSNLEIDAILAAVQKTVSDLGVNGADEAVVSFIGELMTGELQHIETVGKERTGIPTGYSMLDKLLGGLQVSDLVILAARTGIGKSTVALNFCYNAATRVGARSLFVSLEMSKRQVLQKLLALTSSIDSNRIRAGAVHEEEWADLLAAAQHLAPLPIAIADPPMVNMHVISYVARRHAHIHGLDILVVDYMQLIQGSGNADTGNRQQEISYISRSLKALARELNIVVIAISQLSRAVEARGDKRPMLSDLRESGQIEQDADEVIFLYREDYYLPDTDRQNILDLILAKFRHGGTGTCSVYFRKECGKLRDLEITRTEMDY